MTLRAHGAIQPSAGLVVGAIISNLPLVTRLALTLSVLRGPTIFTTQDNGAHAATLPALAAGYRRFLMTPGKAP
jgi:hypothetical protein